MGSSFCRTVRLRWYHVNRRSHGRGRRSPRRGGDHPKQDVFSGFHLRSCADQHFHARRLHRRCAAGDGGCTCPCPELPALVIPASSHSFHSGASVFPRTSRQLPLPGHYLCRRASNRLLPSMPICAAAIRALLSICSVLFFSLYTGCRAHRGFMAWVKDRQPWRWRKARAGAAHHGRLEGLCLFGNKKRSGSPCMHTYMLTCRSWSPTCMVCLLTTASIAPPMNASSCSAPPVASPSARHHGALHVAFSVHFSI